MYTDAQLAEMRYQISLALGEVSRRVDASGGDKQQLQDANDALSEQRSRLEHIVATLDHDSWWADAFATASRAADEAAQSLSYATGGTDLDRPGHMATATQQLARAVQALAQD